MGDAEIEQAILAKEAELQQLRDRLRTQKQAAVASAAGTGQLEQLKVSTHAGGKRRTVVRSEKS